MRFTCLFATARLAVGLWECSKTTFFLYSFQLPIPDNNFKLTFLSTAQYSFSFSAELFSLFYSCWPLHVADCGKWKRKKNCATLCIAHMWSILSIFHCTELQPHRQRVFWSLINAMQCQIKDKVERSSKKRDDDDGQAAECGWKAFFTAPRKTFYLCWLWRRLGCKFW